mgnify:CR=1 FL=1|jgi:hypothetical protein|tara:strand:- start:4466 stop:5110 length:645 start_codon:yes stop_codon:yes gene_type:complete
MKMKFMAVLLAASSLAGCFNEKEPTIQKEGFSGDDFRLEMVSRSGNSYFFGQVDALKNAPVQMYKYTLSELTAYQAFEKGPEKNPLSLYQWNVFDSSPIWQPHNDRQKSTIIGTEKRARYWRAYEVFLEVEGHDYAMDVPIQASYNMPAYSQMISGLMINNGEVIVSYPESIVPKLKENEVSRSVNELVGAIINRIDKDRKIRIERDKLASRSI